MGTQDTITGDGAVIGANRGDVEAVKFVHLVRKHSTAIPLVAKTCEYMI